jgi:hypothetical protein
MTDFLWRVVPDMDDVLRRRVTTLIVAALALVLYVTLSDATVVQRLGDRINGMPLQRGMMLMALAVTLWALAVDLHGEAKGWPVVPRLALALTGVLVVVGLAALPAFHPELAAVWLPAHIGPAMPAMGLLALAAAASGSRGREANTRILLGLLAAVTFFPLSVGIANLIGLAPGALDPAKQAWVFGIAGLLALGFLMRWLPEEGATATPATPGASSAFAQVRDLLLQLVIPVMLILLLVIVATVLRRYLGGTLPMAQGVPDMASPATAILGLLTLTYLYAHGLRAADSPVATNVARALPVLMVLAAGLVLYAIYHEYAVARAADPSKVLHPALLPLGGAHLADLVGRWSIGGLVVLAALLSLGWPGARDLRLPLVVAAIGLLLLAVGPWSVDRIASRALAGQLEALLGAKAIKSDNGMLPAAEVKLSNDDATIVRYVVNRLAAMGHVGALTATFTGASDNPFAGESANQGVLGDRVLQRLGLTPSIASRSVASATRTRVLQLVNRAPRGSAVGIGGFDTVLELTPQYYPQGRPMKEVTIDPRGVPGPSDAPVATPGQTQPAGPWALTTDLMADGKLALTFAATGRSVHFDLQPLLDRLGKREEEISVVAARNGVAQGAHHTREKAPEPISEPEILNAAPGGSAARLILFRLQAHVTEGKTALNHMQAWLLLNQADFAARKP